MSIVGSDVEREDRFVGALLGGAVGDALGSFCEGWPRSRILEVERLLAHYRELRRADGEVVRPGGAYTDDTQQTLVLVESLLARGWVDPGDVADRLLRMWHAGRAVRLRARLSRDAGAHGARRPLAAGGIHRSALQRRGDEDRPGGAGGTGDGRHSSTPMPSR